MSLTVETGAGIVGAESYATEAAADAYWNNRTHTAFYTAWTAATTAFKEGALREASAYLDGQYGKSYRGDRAGYVQGLLWPRTDALDSSGYALPNLPPQIVTASIELAGRAVSARLFADAARGGSIKRTQAGPVSVEYMDGATAGTTYGVIEGLLADLLDGSQGGGATWYWT